MPKLSIIVPMFNSSSYIERCLYSIRIQTFRDYEVVLQDDASSDNTIQIARRFRDVNTGMDIKVFSGEHKGAYGAMNSGCRWASGEWLYFLGSDDELHDPNVLTGVMGTPGLESSDVVYGNVQVIGEAGWARNGSVYDGIFDLKKLLNRNICHQAIFYRATFLRQIGEYNTRYVVCADWDSNMQCWSKTKFKYVDTIVANFHGGGLSGTVRDECFNREMASNVLRYFDLSVYDPLVNTPSFRGFADIVRMQRSKNPVRSIVGRISRIVGSRIERLRTIPRG